MNRWEELLDRHAKTGEPIAALFAEQARINTRTKLVELWEFLGFEVDEEAVAERMARFDHSDYELLTDKASGVVIAASAASVLGQDA